MIMVGIIIVVLEGVSDIALMKVHCILIGPRQNIQSVPHSIVCLLEVFAEGKQITV